MQSVSSRIWTRVAVSISYDDYRYTTGTSERIYNCRSILKTIKTHFSYVLVIFFKRIMNEVKLYYLLCDLFLKMLQGGCETARK